MKIMDKNWLLCKAKVNSYMLDKKSCPKTGRIKYRILENYPFFMWSNIDTPTRGNVTKGFIV